jgi:hypothetical protein
VITILDPSDEEEFTDRVVDEPAGLVESIG